MEPRDAGRSRVSRLRGAAGVRLVLAICWLLVWGSWHAWAVAQDGILSSVMPGSRVSIFFVTTNWGDDRTSSVPAPILSASTPTLVPSGTPCRLIRQAGAGTYLVELVEDGRRGYVHAANFCPLEGDRPAARW